MIAIIDYGVGNLYSLSSSLKYLGISNIITNKAEDLAAADKIILPGVGAFQDAMDKLKESDLIPVIMREVRQGKPLLGICLGMQMLFDKSYEYGEHKGLGLISGEVANMEADLIEPLKVPHMGWNSLDIVKGSPLLKYVKNGDYVYYVHSFYAKNCAQDTLATSVYGGINLTGAVAKGNVYGTQFHPEKSGKVGLSILKAFAEIG